MWCLIWYRRCASEVQMEEKLRDEGALQWACFSSSPLTLFSFFSGVEVADSHLSFSSGPFHLLLSLTPLLHLPYFSLWQLTLLCLVLCPYNHALVFLVKNPHNPCSWHYYLSRHHSFALSSLSLLNRCFTLALSNSTWVLSNPLCFPETTSAKISNAFFLANTQSQYSFLILLGLPTALYIVSQAYFFAIWTLLTPMSLAHPGSPRFAFALVVCPSEDPLHPSPAFSGGSTGICHWFSPLIPLYCSMTRCYGNKIM